MVEQRAAEAERQLAALVAAIENEKPTVQAERAELTHLRVKLPELQAELAAQQVTAAEDAQKMSAELGKARSEAKAISLKLKVAERANADMSAEIAQLRRDADAGEAHRKLMSTNLSKAVS